MGIKRSASRQVRLVALPASTLDPILMLDHWDRLLLSNPVDAELLGLGSLKILPVYYIHNTCFN